MHEKSSTGHAILAADAFINGMMARAKFVVLDSAGGDVESAMDMADYVLQRNMTVVVRDISLSSCANYLFLTGSNKIVFPGGVVRFHGGPPRTEIIKLVAWLESLSVNAQHETSQRTRLY